MLVIAAQQGQDTAQHEGAKRATGSVQRQVAATRARATAGYVSYTRRINPPVKKEQVPRRHHTSMAVTAKGG